MAHSFVSILTEIVTPAVQRVMPDDPITLVRLALPPTPFVGPFAEADMAPGAMQLQIEVAGETFVNVIYHPEVFVSFEDSRDRLISDLADFVAESRFGWGQKRD